MTLDDFRDKWVEEHSLRIWGQEVPEYHADLIAEIRRRVEEMTIPKRKLNDNESGMYVVDAVSYCAACDDILENIGGEK